MRVATALLFALAWLELAESRPDFAASDAKLPAALRRRSQSSFADEPRRFKKIATSDVGSNGKVHLSYDVTIAENVRVLDDLLGIESAHCLPASLELNVTAAGLKDVWGSIAPDDIVHGGTEP
ncbi:hypothetical protein T484DRAFT_1842627 [Baffinella frigidus]|nr:hypothetical protein T484DRAFT_1842627 [Cryptophyta sp. CCMP2293]